MAYIPETSEQKRARDWSQDQSTLVTANWHLRKIDHYKNVKVLKNQKDENVEVLS